MRIQNFKDNKQDDTDPNAPLIMNFNYIIVSLT